MITDIVRRAQVFNLVGNPGYGANGDFRSYEILSRRAPRNRWGLLGESARP